MPALDDELRRLDEDGYVILPEVLGPDERRALTDALAPYEADRRRGRNNFEGEASTRVYSLAGKGEVFLRLAEHPRLVALLDRLLLPNWLLSTLQTIRLHPGETEQPWHTDDGFYPVPRPRARLALSAIWALEAFTDDNGATEVIPGSHRWGPEHPDDRPHEVVRAVMPAGSVVVFDGALWHRGGGNHSSGTRLALSPQYCQPWLRPQESQLLIVPPDQAAACSPRARAMLGYSIHPPFIGQVDGMNPIRLVDPAYRSGNRTNQSAEAALADRFLERPPSQ
jgi:ectoine hydroxylase-related dioxygenase (phytanoyl-CoA dioxygenase family)